MRAWPSLLAILLGGCATAGQSGPPFPFEELLGPWEIGEVGADLVTSTVVFLDTRAALVQCGTVGRRDPAAPPVEVTARGSGWRFRGCGGWLTVHRSADGSTAAYLEYVESRPYNASNGCVRWETTGSRRRCVEVDQSIRYREEYRTREVSFQRPGR